MQYIKYEKHGMVGQITIDRPEALNALNGDMLDQLDKLLDTICSDEIRCVILTGAGEKAFVAGADIGSMRSMTKKEGAAWSKLGNDVFNKLENISIPVIAAVNGYALGGGCELALACDIRIASENAIFAQPEVSLGVSAGFGGTQRLPRLIGVAHAKELLYTGVRIDAVEAYRIGLINKIYPSYSLLEEALKLAEKIAKNAPIAVRATKEAINHGIDTDLDIGIKKESELFGNCFETADQQNAMGAFLEKKKPEPFINK
ncbi:MAG: enoyl-CoA hydratase/isomerase family protein [Oscillospiraceae bacterium]|jgi:enoyl-CoA hydratase|nr:enoyl-CoA hydratase/isomerase family protein [Oscillospiraceae bacterium]